jgi:hypothetical protein
MPLDHGIVGGFLVVVCWLGLVKLDAVALPVNDRYAEPF